MIPGTCIRDHHTVRIGLLLLLVGIREAQPSLSELPLEQRQRNLQFSPGDQCRCEASTENFYSLPEESDVLEHEQLEQQTDFFFDASKGLVQIGGIYVLPATDPFCLQDQANNGDRSFAVLATDSTRVEDHETTAMTGDSFDGP